MFEISGRSKEAPWLTGRARGRDGFEGPAPQVRARRWGQGRGRELGGNPRRSGRRTRAPTQTPPRCDRSLPGVDGPSPVRQSAAPAHLLAPDRWPNPAAGPSSRGVGGGGVGHECVAGFRTSCTGLHRPRLTGFPAALGSAPANTLPRCRTCTRSRRGPNEVTRSGRSPFWYTDAAWVPGVFAQLLSSCPTR